MYALWNLPPSLRMSNIVCGGKFPGKRTRSMTCTNSLPKRRSAVKTRAPLTVVMVSCSVKFVSHYIAQRPGMTTTATTKRKRRKIPTENKTQLNIHTHTHTKNNTHSKVGRVINWDKSCYSRIALNHIESNGGNIRKKWAIILCINCT